MKGIIIVLEVILFVSCKEVNSPQTVEVDFSELANEAETNKNNLLEFFNKTQVRQLYKIKYNNLLDKLTGKFSHKLLN